MSPFITYPWQDEGILELNRAIETGYDIGVEKTRDMGATFLMLQLAIWRWLFRRNETMLFVSAKEEMVDSGENPDALFWKIDFILKNQPVWLLPKYERLKKHLTNQESGNTIDGTSTTSEVGRGGRRTFVGFDEFAIVPDGYGMLASSADTTNCRMFTSTPHGTGNAYYDVMRSGMKKLRFHWREHPEKNPGLYTSNNGELKLLDTDYRFPEGYKFILDGKLRSVWYDKECKRRNSDAEIAQELDIDYGGSGYQYFDSRLIERLNASCVEPRYTGELDYDVQSCEPSGLIPRPDGALKIWSELKDGKPDKNATYILGIDISLGTGASNSCISVVDARRKMKVASYVTSRMKSYDLADLAVALGKWFAGDSENGAFMIWEANGEGRTFGARILDLGYDNVFYRHSETTVMKKATDELGWWTSPATKLMLIGEYRRMLDKGEFINPDIDAIKECGQYIRASDGTLVHTASLKRAGGDPTGAREAHGDRVIADALTTRALQNITFVEKEEEVVIPRNCFYSRRQAFLAAQAKKEMW